MNEEPSPPPIHEPGGVVSPPRARVCVVVHPQLPPQVEAERESVMGDVEALREELMRMQEQGIHSP